MRTVLVAAAIFAAALTSYGTAEKLNTAEVERVKLEAAVERVRLRAKIADLTAEIERVKNRVSPLQDHPDFERVRRYIQRHKHRMVPDSFVIPMTEAVIRSAEKYDLPKGLVLAVVRRETNFRFWAVSSAGAVGAMQVMPEFWMRSDEELSDFVDIAANIDRGCAVLRQYIDEFGLEAGISAYNMGETNTRRGRVNRRYVAAVKSFMWDYAAM